MNHDWLCREAASATPEGCANCAFIAKIRDDERSVMRVSKVAGSLIARAFDNGYREGRVEAAKAVKALAEDWPPHHTDYVVRTALARAAMLAEGKLNAVSAS